MLKQNNTINKKDDSVDCIVDSYNSKPFIIITHDKFTFSVNYGIYKA